MRRKHPDARVFGSFPESYQLTRPYDGYVDAPVRFTECASFDPNLDADRTRLVYIHGYSPGQRACKHLVDTSGARPIVRVAAGSKWVEIWQLPHSSR
ncbi:MAG: hypothetical protein ACREJX_10765 [Polyangiaceae bacterium]